MMQALGYEDGLRGIPRLGCSLAYITGYRQGERARLAAWNRR
jgi:hypothetical protein